PNLPPRRNHQPEPEPAAQRRTTAPEPEPEPAKTAKAVDFTVLEGIGPYYDKALHAVGFTSFADIAAADPDAILEKLLAANYRRHPTIPSWPKQAAFAAKGDWDGLEAFKQKLTAGRLSED
ncbi:MAG: 50S ribosomal protein L21, partial [Chloroflexi bacterium OLB13]